jgi:hypothetical protein
VCKHFLNRLECDVPEDIWKAHLDSRSEKFREEFIVELKESIAEVAKKTKRYLTPEA